MRVIDRVVVPPRCLTSLVARAPDEPLREQLIAAFATDEDEVRSRGWHAELERPATAYVSPREELCAWRLECACGGAVGKLLGVRSDDVYVSPVLHACAACNRSATVFDDAVDGWNAEVDRRKRRRKQRASTFALRCPGCKGTQWRAAAVVAYQGEADNYTAAGDRWPDFFDVMALGGTCERCGLVGLPAAFECA